MHNITYRNHSAFVTAGVLFLLLFLPFTSSAKPIVSTPLQSPCPDAVQIVTAYAHNYPPDWQIVVFCRRSEYKNAEEIWGVRTNIGAFTLLSAKRTFLFFDSQKLKFLLYHELEHIHCMCDLGEGRARR